MFACGEILFNHESPGRSLHFVTRKISAAVACIKNRVEMPPVDELGRPLIDQGKLHLGLLDAKRDWGYAQEYVEAMWLMLQRATPKDTSSPNTTHTVRDVCRVAFAQAGLDWEDYVVTMSSCSALPKSRKCVATPLWRSRNWGENTDVFRRPDSAHGGRHLQRFR